MPTMRNAVTDPRVSVARDAAAIYPSLADAPFHPSEPYPEYAGPLGGARNDAYRLVREALAGLGLDAANFGTPAWNPLGEVAPRGGRIVIKPNWVLHANEGPGGTDCLITHAAVLRALVDYALKTKPRQIVVGDAPVQVCRFEGVQALGFDRVADHFRLAGAPVVVKDFRRTTMVRETHRADVTENRHALDEFVLVDLGARSFVEPISRDARRFRVTMYDPRRMAENHRPGVHRYLVARDILEADLVLNAPKLKTHKKAGITAALKNLVGINGNKDYLPHHRKGGADRGGDNYAEASLPKSLAETLLDYANRHLDRPRFYAHASRLAYRFLYFDRIRGRTTDIEGGWYGNDTVWRMCLDLNRVLLYGDAKGMLRDVPQRNVLSVTDGILAGEGDGPLAPVPKPFGAILAALNPAAHDWIAALLMGLDPSHIPISSFAVDPRATPPLTGFDAADITCCINGRPVPLAEVPAHGESFEPPLGWRGHCELHPSLSRSSP